MRPLTLALAAAAAAAGGAAASESASPEPTPRLPSASPTSSPAPGHLARYHGTYAGAATLAVEVLSNCLVGGGFGPWVSLANYTREVPLVLTLGPPYQQPPKRSARAAAAPCVPLIESEASPLHVALGVAGNSTSFVPCDAALAGVTGEGGYLCVQSAVNARAAPPGSPDCGLADYAVQSLWQLRVVAPSAAPSPVTPGSGLRAAATGTPAEAAGSVRIAGLLVGEGSPNVATSSVNRLAEFCGAPGLFEVGGRNVSRVDVISTQRPQGAAAARDPCQAFGSFVPPWDTVDVPLSSGAELAIVFRPPGPDVGTAPLADVALRAFTGLDYGAEFLPFTVNSHYQRRITLSAAGLRPAGAASAAASPSLAESPTATAPPAGVTCRASPSASTPASASRTATVSRTPSASRSDSQSPTVSATASPTPSQSGSPTVSETPSPSPSPGLSRLYGFYRGRGNITAEVLSQCDPVGQGSYGPGWVSVANETLVDVPLALFLGPPLTVPAEGSGFGVELREGSPLHVIFASNSEALPGEAAFDADQPPREGVIVVRSAWAYPFSTGFHLPTLWAFNLTRGLRGEAQLAGVNVQRTDRAPPGTNAWTGVRPEDPAAIARDPCRAPLSGVDDFCGRPDCWARQVLPLGQGSVMAVTGLGPSGGAPFAVALSGNTTLLPFSPTFYARRFNLTAVVA